MILSNLGPALLVARGQADKGNGGNGDGWAAAVVGVPNEDHVWRARGGSADWTATKTGRHRRPLNINDHVAARARAYPCAVFIFTGHSLVLLAVAFGLSLVRRSYASLTRPPAREPGRIALTSVAYVTGSFLFFKFLFYQRFFSRHPTLQRNAR